MSNVEVSKPLPQSAMTIEPVKEKRLELGKKVFKVPTQSKRRSSRIKRPEGKKFQTQEKSAGIVHHLLLAPTLKRQKKKKLEREKKTTCSRRKTKAEREWKWDFDAKFQEEIKLSEIFSKSPNHLQRRSQSSQRRKSHIHAARRKKRIIDTDKIHKIRRLARCGGLKVIAGLEVYDNKGQSRRESIVPPPFEAKNSDPYILPKPGQLISYLWHSRPSPVLGRKHIYRTGILCSSDGTIRFFESNDDCTAKNNEDRKFYEGRFYLNKQVFKKGNFRVRTDLVVGAICYEREMRLPCKIVEIDETSGAVQVESLVAQDGCTNHLWISPDDLVGNFENFELANVSADLKTENITLSSNVNPNDVQSHQASFSATADQAGRSISNYCSSACETIDLTQEDDYEDHPRLVTPLKASQKSSDFHSRFKPQFRGDIRERSLTGNSSAMQVSHELATPRFTPTVSADSVTSESILSSPDLPINECNRGREFGNQSLRDSEFTNIIRNQPLLLGRTQPALRGFTDESRRARAIPNIASSMTASLSFDGSPRARVLSERFAALGSSSYTSLHGGTTIQSELDLLKQHGMALEILMSATDLGTIVACLQFIKRMHQRGIPVGPTAAKVVSAAEMTSRALMEDAFLKHMTAPVCSGGKGYNMPHAGIILCRLAPILGSNLGRLDSPTVDTSKLLSFGLNRDEVLDVLPYVQSFEDDILMKTISFKRQLTSMY